MKNTFEVADNGVVTIDVGNGMFTLISADDLQRVHSFPGLWRGVRSKNNNYVVGSISRNRKSVTVYLHRFITQCPTGFVVDHSNYDGLDNQRHNLRIVTNAENLQNLVGAKVNSKSGARNVYFDKYFDKWVAEVSVNGVTVYKKRFLHKPDAEVAAAMARLKFQPYSPEGTAARIGATSFPGIVEFIEYDLWNCKGMETNG